LNSTLSVNSAPNGWRYTTRVKREKKGKKRGCKTQRQRGEQLGIHAGTTLTLENCTEVPRRAGGGGGEGESRDLKQRPKGTEYTKKEKK